MSVAIGIDLGGTFIKYALVDKSGQIIINSIKLTRAETNRENVIQTIESVICELIDYASSKCLTISGIGLGTPGVIDNGLILGGSENIPEWESLPLRRILEKVFFIPVFIENDANLAGLTEATFGVAKKR